MMRCRGEISGGSSGISEGISRNSHIQMYCEATSRIISIGGSELRKIGVVLEPELV